MTILQMDVETYSSVELKDYGAYRYMASPDFEIMLLAYAFDDDPVQVIDLACGESAPSELLDGLRDPSVTKTAFNAAFERGAIHRHYDLYCDPLYWRCTMVMAYALGLPGSLAGVGEVLKLGIQKDPRGEALIRYFSKPCAPTKINGGRTRNLPAHDLEKWEEYKAYNRRDVEVEREARKRMEKRQMPKREWELWALDQRINDRGVLLDPRVYRNAIDASDVASSDLFRRAQEITGLQNPNSNKQIRGWLEEQGLPTPDGIGKDYLPYLIDQAPNDTVREVLEIRSQSAKTSLDKYKAMERYAGDDGRARGILQFAGAGRTWRWAGRGVQMHNLPQNHLEDLAGARELLVSGDYDLLELSYGPLTQVLSELIRTAIIPAPGNRFIVADFNAIEARVIAWLADEQWVLDVFEGDGKIYEATAAQMFGIPQETIVRGHPNYSYRPLGKIGQLACGFGGGEAALIKMDKKHEIDPALYADIVKRWRSANPKIKALWYKAQDAAIAAVRSKGTVELCHGVRYRYAGGYLFADLPSGRSLAYPQPRIEYDPKFERQALTFCSWEQKKVRGSYWVRGRTWGGTLVENLVQAIARDCLAEAMRLVDVAGYAIPLHVHDEIVLEVPEGISSVDEVIKLMSRPVAWAPGLPLKAAGFECTFYQKD